MKRLLSLALLLTPLSCVRTTQQTVDITAVPLTVPAAPVLRASAGMVVSGSPIASRVGARILEDGGNAVDAAVATAFVLSVVEPTMSGIGGRTQALIRTGKGEYFGIDGGTAVPSSYIKGTVPANDDAYGYQTIAVPGTVAALAAMLERHGTMRLDRVLAPAIRLAREGFVLSEAEAQRIASDLRRLSEFTGSRRYFLKPDGTAYRPGERFTQADLASTLEGIAKHGPRWFYTGAVARQMADHVRAQGGFLQLRDLESYKADESRVVKGSYRGYELVGTYLPASGVTSIQTLHILENFDLAKATPTEWAALMHQSLLLAFEDRDRDFGGEERKAAALMSKQYAAERAKLVRKPGAAQVPFAPEQAWPYEPEHTTHLSVADARGGVVALTQSVGPNLGSKVAAPGLGFLYAATMGYLGDVQPGDRPYSSQSPLIVTQNGELRFVLGAAGARRIIPAVVGVLSRAIDQKLSFEAAMAAPRLHALPDRIDLERRPAASWTRADSATLTGWGFNVRTRADAPYFARIHGIYFDAAARTFVGVADPRWQGAAAAPREPLDGERVEADLLLLGGVVYDGAGNPWTRHDIAVTGDRITFVGNARVGGITAKDTLNVRGLMVTPGLWDVHSHADFSHAKGRQALPLLYQGVTTVVMGVDGDGSNEIASTFAQYQRAGIAVNAIRYVGHGAARGRVMGVADREPTGAELTAMKEYIRKGMREGAVGLSTGLFYSPGSFAKTEEVIELARVAAEFNGSYDTHDRDLGVAYQGIGYLNSIREAIRIGEEAGTPVIFSHFNAQGVQWYGRAGEGAKLIDEARARGVNVVAGQHTYTATNSSLAAYALPRWAVVGGQAETVRRLQDPAVRARLEREIPEMLQPRGGAAKLLFSDRRKDLNGQTLDQVARAWKVTVQDAVIRIVSEGNASVMNLDLYDDANTRQLAQKEWMMTCTDGYTPADTTIISHPRSYGSFTKKLLMARDDRIISLPFALRGMTSLPANFYGFRERGLLLEGAYADIAVFDLPKVRDLATYERPHQYSEGTVHVIVNGRVALRDGRPTGVLPGRPLPRER